MSANWDGIPIFTGVMKGYPAHIAGIKQGGLVTLIDGEDITTLSVDEAVWMVTAGYPGPSNRPVSRTRLKIPRRIKPGLSTQKGVRKSIPRAFFVQRL